MKHLFPITRRNILKAGLGIGAVGSMTLIQVDASKQRAPATSHRGVASPDASPGATPEASPGATPHSDELVTVEMTAESQFDPKEIVIAVGTTVEWINTSEIQHTASGDPEQNPFKKTQPDLIVLPDGAEPWGSELLEPGESYSHTFTVAGDYHYICYPHVLSGMQGSIRVEA